MCLMCVCWIQVGIQVGDTRSKAPLRSQMVGITNVHQANDASNCIDSTSDGTPLHVCQAN